MSEIDPDPREIDPDPQNQNSTTFPQIDQDQDPGSIHLTTDVEMNIHPPPILSRYASTISNVPSKNFRTSPFLSLHDYEKQLPNALYLRSRMTVAALMICQAGILLKLPQSIVCTAQSYLWRYYTSNAFSKNDPLIMMSACTFLSCKAGEWLRSLDSIIIVFSYLLQVHSKSPSTKTQLANDLEPQDLFDLVEPKLPYPVSNDSKVFLEYQKLVMDYERELLVKLNFLVTWELPFPMMILLIENIWKYEENIPNLSERDRNNPHDTKKQLIQVAYSYINDIYKTIIPAFVSSTSIAVAAINFSFVSLKIKIVPEFWWRHCAVTDEEIRFIYSLSQHLFYQIGELLRKDAFDQFIKEISLEPSEIGSPPIAKGILSLSESSSPSPSRSS